MSTHGRVVGCVLAVGGVLFLAVHDGAADPAAAAAPQVANQKSPFQAVLPRETNSSTGLSSHLISAAGKAPLLVVVSAETKRIGVYQIDPDSGALTLKSVRNATWDFQMDDYNTGAPLPQEIREALPRP